MSYGNSALGNNELGSTATASRPIFGTQPITAEISLETANIQYLLTQPIDNSYNIGQSSLQDLNIDTEPVAAEYSLENLRLTTGTLFLEPLKAEYGVGEASLTGTTILEPDTLEYSYNVETVELTGETLMTSEVVMSNYSLGESELTPILLNQPVNASYNVENSIIPHLATQDIDSEIMVGGSSLQDLNLDNEPVNAEYNVDETRFDVLGRSGELNVYINGTRIDSYQEMEIEERLNEPDTFSFTAFIVEDSQRGLISQGNDIVITEGFNLLFKGRLEEVNYNTSFQAECQGEGMETKLLDRKTGRDEYINKPADDMVRDITPTDTVTLGTIEDAPTTSIRFDHDNKARGVAGVANAVGYDWNMRQEIDDKFDTDYLDFVARQGSESSVKTFSIGEDAQMVDDGGDDSFVANDITLLGRGDGINQLEARVYAASEEFTQLTNDVSETANTITVDDTSVLGSVGDNIVAKIGVELVDADIVDGTTLSVNSRGVTNFDGDETEQILHRENVSVWLYENKTQNLGPFTPENKESAQTGSSIAEKGVKQLRETDKTIIKLPTLEVIADRELRNRYMDVKQIEVNPSDPRIAGDVDIGDTITIEDGLGADLLGDYRVVGMDHTRRSSGEGTVLHCANRPRRLVERLSEIDRDKDTLNAHMQGATNIDTQTFKDNCDQNNPLKTKIYVPEDAVAVNKVELTAAREDFRGYVQNESHSHSLTIELDDHDHSFDIYIPNHEHELQGFKTVGARIEDPDFQENTEVISGTGVFEVQSAGSELDNVVTTGKFNESTDDHNHLTVQSDQYPFDLELEYQDTDSSSDLVVTWPPGLIGENNPKEFVMDIDFSEEDNQTTESGGGYFESTTTENSSSDVKTATADSAGEPVYGIFEQSESGDIDIDVVVDGTTVQTITGVSPGQELADVIRVEEDLSEPIAGEWHDLELVPSSQTRLTANVFKKVFIESTV